MGLEILIFTLVFSALYIVYRSIIYKKKKKEKKRIKILIFMTKSQKVKKTKKKNVLQ